MTRITQDDIIRMNTLYLKIKTYAGVARETGFSPTTVKKYIIPNFKPMEEVKVKKFEGDITLASIEFEKFRVPKWNEFILLTDEEIEEIKELWEEMVI